VNVAIHLGEPFWRAIQSRTVNLSLADDARLADALSSLVERYPALSADLSNGEAQPALFIGDETASLDSRLSEGTSIYILWPASGG
jgi:molybdopterin converting factor small subunit